MKETANKVNATVNTPANVANLLNAATYVRNETIINGTQAAQLDHMVKIISEYQDTISEAPRKIAELEAAGKEKGAAMWRRILERDTKDLAELCAQLRAWLVDFKVNRPNVQINLDEPEPINPDNTPTTMNANEITLTAEAAAVYNAMLTPSEEPADLAWESEPKTDEELTALGLDAFGDNGTTTETTAPEFSELSHAGQCLDIYLHNTREIYELYTTPVISALVDNDRNNGGRTNWDNVINNLCDLNPCEPLCTLEGKIYRAIDRARRLVRQFDGLTPTAKDIEEVTRNYAAYIVESATFEIENA